MGFGRDYRDPGHDNPAAIIRAVAEQQAKFQRELETKIMAKVDEAIANGPAAQVQRLECLRLAVGSAADGITAQGIITAADTFFQFVQNGAATDPVEPTNG